jgi:predicted flap endonuclease-1-like 5' DNA nuclease
MASYSIADVRAIPPFYAGKLKAAGIRTTGKLLERAATPKLRKALSEATDIPTAHILDWANIADLTRVSGIAPELAELLVAAGVGTVKDLGRRNAANLVTRMTEINGKKPRVRALPSEKRVVRWVESAKKLAPGVDY